MIVISVSSRPKYTEDAMSSADFFAFKLTAANSTSVKEMRRRIREEEAPPFKKRRDDTSPNQQHSSLSSKTRGHMPVSERQQFALLKQMENREQTSDRATKQTSQWDGPSTASSSCGGGNAADAAALYDRNNSDQTTAGKRSPSASAPRSTPAPTRPESAAAASSSLSSKPSSCRVALTPTSASHGSCVGGGGSGSSSHFPATPSSFSAPPPPPPPPPQPSGYSMSPPQTAAAVSDPSPSSHGYQRHPHHSSFAASSSSSATDSQQQQREQREHKSRPTSIGADSSPSMTDRRPHLKPAPGHEAPLMKTAKKGDLEGIKILVKEGVDINEQDSSGRTALHECSSRNHSRVVAYLLRHNADPNLKGARGNTALHEAAQAGHIRVIRSLLRHGADPKISNGNGDRAIDLCPNELSATILRQMEDSPESSHSSQPSSFASKKQETTSPPIPSSRSSSSHEGHQRSHHHHHHQSQSSGGGGGGGGDSSSRQRHSSFVEDRKDLAYRPKSEHLSPFEHSSRSEQHGKHPKLTDSATAALAETNSPVPAAAVSHRSNLPAGKTSGDGAHFHHHHHHHQSASSTPGDANTGHGSHRTRSSNSPKDQAPSSLSSQASRRSSTLSEKNPETLGTHIGRSSAKKDPYAFDDEEQDLSPPLPHSTVGVGAGSSSGTLGASAAMATATASTTPTNAHASTPTGGGGGPGNLEGTTSSPITRRFSCVASVPSTPLPSIQVNAHSDQSGPSSVSPNSTSSVGPPLKLRFAKEAGHYTLMEQQQLQEHMAEQQQQQQQQHQQRGGGGRSGPLKSSPSGTPEVKESDSCKSSPTGQAQERVLPAAAHLPSASDAPPSSATAVTSQAGGETQAGTPLKAEGVVRPGSCPNNQSPDAHETEPNQKPQGDEEDQDSRSQKVPPLRIKLAAGGGSDLGSCEHTTTDSHLPLEEASATASDSAVKPEVKAESPAPSSVPGSESVESKKLEPAVTTSTSATAGSVTKNAETGVLSSSRRRTGAVPTRTASRGQRLAEEGQSEVHTPSDSEIKVEEQVNPRSSRTLRSHTAAQREREERDRHTDNAPIKKRKIRSKAGDSEATAYTTNGSDSRDDNGSDMPMTDHGADSCSSLDHANNNNHGLSTGISAAKAEQYEGYESTANSAGSSGEAACDATLRGFPSSSTVKAFDDPLKPSPLAWGENPYDKAAALNKGLNELIGKLVELQPKEPTGYQDYLLVTREYLLHDRIPSHLVKRPCPINVEGPFAELFEEQEEERYAQALKHESEREQLRLCAEQSVLRAQTRATIALANQPRPLSFCSVMALNGFTYLPPFKSSDHRDEESVRDRFNARILIGWLQDIKDNFQKEKRRLLCRQLHEAESLMMVQKLDWEVKLKELHMCDCRANVFDEILPQHVPLIEVPNDFPLFVHDPI